MALIETGSSAIRLCPRGQAIWQEANSTMMVEPWCSRRALGAIMLRQTMAVLPFAWTTPSHASHNHLRAILWKTMKWLGI